MPNSHLVESFCVAFFKKRLGFGATPRYSAFFGSFLRLLAQKRTERIFSLQTPNSHLVESFCVAFFKKRLGFGATPRYSAFFGSFLRLLAQKRTERIFSSLHVLILSPLSSLTSQAQRRKLGKEETLSWFRSLRRATRASRPRPAVAF